MQPLALHPCGMVMDFLRAPYPVPMRTWQGAGPITDVQWFAAPEGAAWQEHSSPMRSRVWLDSSERANAGLGEQIPFDYECFRFPTGPAPAPAFYTGHHSCPPAGEIWNIGGLFGTDAPVPLDPDGGSACCRDPHPFGAIMRGGSVEGGSAVGHAAFTGLAEGGGAEGGAAASTAAFFGASSGGSVEGGAASATAQFFAEAGGGGAEGGSVEAMAKFFGTARGGAVEGGRQTGTAHFYGTAAGGAVEGGAAIVPTSTVTSPPRVTQVVVEVLVTGYPAARVTTLTAEVIVAGRPAANVTQVVAEVLRVG